jgi:hypothetical protein
MQRITYGSEGNENQGEDEHTCPNFSWKECCYWTHLH